MLNAGLNYVCNKQHIPGFVFDASKFTRSGGVGTINGGLYGQLAYFPADGDTLSGTAAIPNGVTAMTQAPGDTSARLQRWPPWRGRNRQGLRANGWPQYARIS